MGSGFSITRHDGLASYAASFAAAGLGVLVFHYRHFGDSPGRPRQRFRKRLQVEDWRAALAFSREGLGIPIERTALWGFSFGGGHAIEIAARERSVAGMVLLCPVVDGLPRALRARLGFSAWVLPRAVADRLGVHSLIPVTSEPGGRAAMSRPGEAAGFADVVPAVSSWRNEVSPGALATLPFYRPVRLARRLVCPVWVGMGERDISVPAAAIERLARRAPRAELHRYDVDHFEALGGAGGRISCEQVEFLTRLGLVARPARRVVE